MIGTVPKLRASHAYLLATLVTLVGNVTLITFWRDNAEDALSYVADNAWQPYILLMSYTLAVVALTIYFLKGHFFAHVDASKTFRTTYYLGLLSLVVLNATPSLNPTLLSIHLGLGLLSFGVNLFIYAQLVLNPVVRMPVKLYTLLTVIIASLMFVLVKSIWSQVIFTALGQSVIIVCAYWPKAIPPLDQLD